MPLGPQPRRARGTVERPYSALWLRLALAIFGLVICLVEGAIVWGISRVFAVVLFAGALIAAVDIVVVSIRLRRR
jgi:hypothetical protein